MKKTLFSILISAALLFSCTKSEVITQLPLEATNDLSITISGTSQISQFSSKASSSEETAITSATAFVFRGAQDNAILDCNPIILRTDNATTTAKVTSEAEWVFIITNESINSASIKTLGDLKALTAQLYDGSEITQKEGGLIMWGSNSIDKTGSTYTSSVTLRFAPAKVTFKYTVAGANAANLTAHSLTIFNAQGTSRLFPENTIASSKADKISLLPTTQSYLAGSSMESFAVKPADHTVTATLLNDAVNSEGTYTYYLFENDETHPTIFALSGNFAGTTLYYPIAFSKNDSGASTSEFEPIKAGQQYDVTVNVKNILSGSTDPTKPATSQDIEITVVPADWETTIEWVKDFE